MATIRVLCVNENCGANGLIVNGQEYDAIPVQGGYCISHVFWSDHRFTVVAAASQASTSAQPATPSFVKPNWIRVKRIRAGLNVVGAEFYAAIVVSGGTPAYDLYAINDGKYVLCDYQTNYVVVSAVPARVRVKCDVTAAIYTNAGIVQGDVYDAEDNGVYWKIFDANGTFILNSVKYDFTILPSVTSVPVPLAAATVASPVAAPTQPKTFRVQCIDATGTGRLTLSSYYDAETNAMPTEYYIYSAGKLLGRYERTRFTVVSPSAYSPTGMSAPVPTKIYAQVGEKVRCINASDVEDTLSVGMVYTVVRVISVGGIASYVIFIKITGFPTKEHEYAAERFELYFDTICNGPATKRSAAIDLVEEKMWMKMRPYREPGHCACGCLRSLCRFHKD